MPTSWEFSVILLKSLCRCLRNVWTESPGVLRSTLKSSKIKNMASGLTKTPLSLAGFSLDSNSSFVSFLINFPQWHLPPSKVLSNKSFSFEQLWQIKYFVGSVSSTFTFSLWQELSNGLRGECSIFLQTLFQKTSESKWSTLWYSLLMEPSCTCCSNVFPSRIIVPNGSVRKLKRTSTKSPLASATITRLFFSSTQYLKGIVTSSLEAITETQN